MEFFAEDSYTTSETTKRYLIDKTLNSRHYLVANYVAILLRARVAITRGRNSVEARAKRAFDIFRLVEGCGGRFHMTGLDNIRKCDGPTLFVSNHMSTLEANIFPCLLAPCSPMTFVIKRSLLKYPIFGPILESTNPITVNRVNPREDFQKVMQDGQALLQQGVSLVIFPQSTRSDRFDPEQFNSLGVKLARRAKVKILPIALKTDFWGNGRAIRDFGPIHREKRIHFAFGEPFSPEGSAKVAHKRVLDFIQGRMGEWAERNA